MAAAITVLPTVIQAEVITTGNLSVLLGQGFFQRKFTSFNGYLNGDLAAALRLDPANTLTLSYAGLYQNFANSEQLEGGGLFFQQSMTHQVLTKWTSRPSRDFAFKPYLGIRKNYSQETKDEPWGQGLFDSLRLNPGMEWQSGEESSGEAFCLGYDFYWTHYPNFKDNLGQRFGQELSQEQFNPGSRLLDSLAHQFTYSSDSINEAEGIRGKFSAIVNYKAFLDQRVVHSDGTFSSGKRRDYLGSLIWRSYLEGRRKKESRFSLSYMHSNQNHLDSDISHPRFIPNFYDYIELERKKIWGFRSEPPFIRLGNEIRLRYYLGRIVQDAGGEYEGNTKVITLVDDFNFKLGAPISTNVAWQAALRLSLGLANTFYQQPYQYIYFAANYFGGLSWRF